MKVTEIGKGKNFHSCWEKNGHRWTSDFEYSYNPQDGFKSFTYQGVDYEYDEDTNRYYYLTESNNLRPEMDGAMVRSRIGKARYMEIYEQLLEYLGMNEEETEETAETSESEEPKTETTETTETATETEPETATDPETADQGEMTEKKMDNVVFETLIRNAKKLPPCDFPGAAKLLNICQQMNKTQLSDFCKILIEKGIFTYECGQIVTTKGRLLICPAPGVSGGA